MTPARTCELSLPEYVCVLLRHSQNALLGFCRKA